MQQKAESGLLETVRHTPIFTARLESVLINVCSLFRNKAKVSGQFKGLVKNSHRLHRKKRTK